jgi:hypothetical protein
MQQLSDPSVGSLVLALTRVKPSLTVLLRAPEAGAHEVSHIEISDTAVVLYGHSDENAPLHTDRILMQAQLTTVSILLGILQTSPLLWRVAVHAPIVPVPMTHMRQSTLAQTVLLTHGG